jgi:nematocidal protein AidA
MSNIDILTVVDATTLMDLVATNKLSPGTFESPTNLGSYAGSDVFIFMIADGEYVPNGGQGKSELTVSANVNDVIRWTITNPSADFTYNCILYSFQSAAIAQNIISTPTCATMPVVSYYNSLLDSTTPVPSAYMYSVWSTSILNVGAGSVQYTWSFQVIDSTNGQVVGWFTWDPFIQIKSN